MAYFTFKVAFSVFFLEHRGACLEGFHWHVAERHTKGIVL